MYSICTVQGLHFTKSVPICTARYCCPSIKEVGRKSCKFVDLAVHEKKFYNICWYLFFCVRGLKQSGVLSAFCLTMISTFKLILFRHLYHILRKNLLKLSAAPAIRRRETDTVCCICTVCSLCSVADPGCLYPIWIFPFRIPVEKVLDPDPHRRILVF